MIHIGGSAQRTFYFPADRKTTYEFFADMGNTFRYLPHITLVKHFNHGQYRMLFSTYELGIYHVRIFCDLRSEFDPPAWILRMRPLENMQPVSGKAGLNTLTAQGYFNSESIFHEEDGQTRIDYRLDLKAAVPVPLGLRLMPERIIKAIANNITQSRFQETVDGFIERTLEAYQNHGSKTI